MVSKNTLEAGYRQETKRLAMSSEVQVRARHGEVLRTAISRLPKVRASNFSPVLFDFARNRYMAEMDTRSQNHLTILYRFPQMVITSTIKFVVNRFCPPFDRQSTTGDKEISRLGFEFELPATTDSGDYIAILCHAFGSITSPF